ncbi:MAG: imidazolonepropionase-like domain-containing protein, partial [Acidimicrobiia bacterium]
MTDVPAGPTGPDDDVTLLVNADVVTMNSNRDVLIGGAVAFSGDRIVAVGATSTLRTAHPDADVIDLSGCVVTPGMIDAHQHLTGDPLIRSCIPDLLPPGASIFEWSVPVHGAHQPDDDEAAAVLSAVEALCAGVTTVVEAGTVAHADRVAAGLTRIGQRATLGVWGWDIEHGPFA